MNLPLIIYSSPYINPAKNLAMEEACMDQGGFRRFLLFYRNRPCVIIGKNQNIWLEVNLAFARQKGITLCRRLSGGGTVYHDQGNLNFCLIEPRSHFVDAEHTSWIIEALKELGLEVKARSGHSLYCGDRKISGNAYCYKKEVVLHHGTLLVQTNLNQLQESLLGLQGIQHNRGILSKPAQVANLADMQKNLSTKLVQSKLTEMAKIKWGGRQEEWHFIHGLKDEFLDQTSKKYTSEEWTFFKTPPFEWQCSIDDSTGLMKFIIKNGHVAELIFLGASMNKKLCKIVHDVVKGGPFQSKLIAERLKNLPDMGKSNASIGKFANSILKIGF